MRSIGSQRAFALVVALVLGAGPLAALAAVGDPTADVVVGQPDATSHEPNAGGGVGVGSGGVNGPFGVAFDGSGNLFVVDLQNHRVLGYLSPTTTDGVADLVIGQPDFESATPNNGGVSASSLFAPAGVAATEAGDLYIADSNNHRILEYNRPFATDTVADFVIGQPGFTTNGANTGGVGPATLFFPNGLAVDANGNLWVTDELNNRVLEYDDPIATADATADLVLGQPSFTSNTENAGGISASSLRVPTGIDVDSRGAVWVSDSVNNRVLEYDDPKRTDTAADLVLGQPSFRSNVPNFSGSVDATGLNAPIGLGVDVNGNVYVCDLFNNRVLIYTSPISTDDGTADLVLGQPDLGASEPNNGGISARTLASPLGLALDPFGNVAVADRTNNRVVLFQTPAPIVASLAVKVTRATGRAKLVVRGFGMAAGDAVVEVDGRPLATTRYAEIAADGSARRLVARDANFDVRVPRGVPVKVTILNPRTGSRSAPISFVR